MGFRELREGLRKKLPKGASDRYVELDALGKMLSGDLYDHLPYSFDQEKDSSGKYIPLRQRRPSTDFCLAHEITQDTLAELFGDEQFPTVKVLKPGDSDDTALDENSKATAELSDLIEELALDAVISAAYEEGVVGSVAIVVMAQANGMPYYDILPGKWCEPIYRDAYSTELVALVVTYPITREVAEKEFPAVVKDDPDQNYWYRFVVDQLDTIDYTPMSDHKFCRLGEKDENGKEIEFAERARKKHGFKGRLPVSYSKNLRYAPRSLDGPCLWWPIRNICIDVDYTLSQTSRGLRYTSDPKLFLRRGDLFDQDDVAAGYAGAGGGMSSQNLDGDMVHSATNVLVGGPGADAKLLEIAGTGIKEEREFIRDLREYALEVVGGMKARAEHMRGAASGTAIDKGLKPLRRLVRRQRRPYGNGMLSEVVDLTLYGYSVGAFDAGMIETNVAAIPLDAKRTLDWPNDETLQGAELLAHATGMQLAAGGSAMNPKELLNPEDVGEKLAADIGFHDAYAKIKGSGELQQEPEDPNAAPDPKKKIVSAS